MLIEKIVDQPDGSAIMHFRMSEQENNFFVEYAIIDILREELRRHERSWENIKQLIIERFDK